MKSINEFATEYAQDKYLPVQTSQAVNAGTNYVLDAIVGIINQPMNDYLVLEELWNTIEELRK